MRQIEEVINAMLEVIPETEETLRHKLTAARQSALFGAPGLRAREGC